MTAVEASSFPSVFKEGWLRLNKKVPFLNGADGVVSKRSRSLLMNIRVAHLNFCWNLLTTPSAPLRNGTFLLRRSHPSLKTEGNGPVSQPTHPLHPASQPVGQFCRGIWFETGGPLCSSFPRVFRASRANAQIFDRLFIEPFTLIRIPQRLANDTPNYTRPEIICIVEPIDGGHHFFSRQTWIFDMRELVPAIVRHGIRQHGIAAGELFIQFCPGEGMRDRHLNRFDVQFLRKVEAALNGFFRLARQTNDEVTVNPNTNFLAVLCEGARLLDRRPLLDILQNLRITGLVAHYE